MGTIACSRSPCRGPLRGRKRSITGMLTWRFLSCLPCGPATHFLGLSLPPSKRAGPGAALTLSLAGSGARQHLPLVSPETQTSAWESWEGASPPGAHSRNFWKIWADSAVSFRTRSPEVFVSGELGQCWTPERWHHWGVLFPIRFPGRHEHICSVAHEQENPLSLLGRCRTFMEGGGELVRQPGRSLHLLTSTQNLKRVVSTRIPKYTNVYISSLYLFYTCVFG